MSDASVFERFRALHERPGGFVMPNAWDGGSAVLLARAGFEALGSSAFAVAIARGRRDGAGAHTRAGDLASATFPACFPHRLGRYFPDRRHRP